MKTVGRERTKEEVRAAGEGTGGGKDEEERHEDDVRM